MKKEKGITLTSLIIYIIITILVTGMLATIIVNFSSNVADYGKNSIEASNLDKFYAYFIQEIKKTKNEIIETTENSITFKTGNKYIFEKPNIYLEDLNNSKIKICDKIDNCIFTKMPNVDERKQSVKTEITIGETTYVQEFILFNSKTKEEIIETEYVAKDLYCEANLNPKTRIMHKKCKIYR